MLEFELVLPAFNEARSLESIVSKTVNAARSFGFKSGGFQLILVDNGSTDQTPEVLDRLKKNEEGTWFQVVRVDKNQGYGHGLWQGLQRTSAKFVGWSHSDEQCDPADAFKALDVLKKKGGPGLVKGQRLGRDKKDAAVTRMFEVLAKWIVGLNVAEINAQPKVFPRELLTDFTRPPKTFAFDLYALYKAHKKGYWIDSIPVSFPRRAFGLSRWSSNFLSRYKTMMGMISYMFKLSTQEGRL